MRLDTDHEENLRRVTNGELSASDVDYFSDIAASQGCFDHAIWKDDDCGACRSQRRAAEDEKRAHAAMRELEAAERKADERARRAADRADLDRRDADNTAAKQATREAKGRTPSTATEQADRADAAVDTDDPTDTTTDADPGSSTWSGATQTTDWQTTDTGTTEVLRKLGLLGAQPETSVSLKDMPHAQPTYRRVSHQGPLTPTPIMKWCGRAFWFVVAGVVVAAIFSLFG